MCCILEVIPKGSVSERKGRYVKPFKEHLRDDNKLSVFHLYFEVEKILFPIFFNDHFLLSPLN